MYIVFSILIFGFLIVIHELGHFAAARACGVRVNEFSIGMGPTLLKRQGKETLYSLRLIPIGGFCAMEGEDEASDDTGSFSEKPHWKRLIILMAGSAANFLAGFLVIAVLCAGMTRFVGTTLTDLAEGFPHEGTDGLMEGDTIYSINGRRTYYSPDFLTFMALANGAPVDMVVLRDGEKLLLEEFPLEALNYGTEEAPDIRYGVSFNQITGSVWEQTKYICYNAMNYVRSVWISLEMLFSGQAGVNDLAGPVGMVGMMNDLGQSAETASEGLRSIVSFGAFIAINLAVMNMLPIPGLDGGHIFLMAISWCVEKITRRKLNPKYEGYINTAGLVLLFGLMAFVMLNDIIKLFQ